MNEEGEGTREPVKLGINFPPVKSKDEILREKVHEGQQAAIPDGAIREGLESEMPPIIRSVLELSHLMMSGHSQWLRATPGYQGGLFHCGSPYCFASGYRDAQRPCEIDERGNHMKLKDPLVYGVLSLPITAAYLCELHGRGIFDINKPLNVYLPEMSHEKLPSHVTARSILSFRDAVDDAGIVKDITGSRLSLWYPRVAWNTWKSARKHIYEPLEKFFSHSTLLQKSAVDGNEAGKKVMLPGVTQRRHLYYYLCSSRSASSFFRRWSPHRARPSHFSIALLLHAVETQLQRTPCHLLESADPYGAKENTSTKCCMKEVSFEESIRKLFFERAESHGAGYGVPAIWRNPQDLFYQPTGLALQHSSFSKPIPSGDPGNCALALFNGSLNLFAPSEDYGKLLLLSLDAIRGARQLLEFRDSLNLGPQKKEKISSPYYDFGVTVLPKTNELRLLPPVWFSSLESMIPASSSFRYACDKDLGCFGVASCGSRSGRLFANHLSRLIQHLYVKHALQNSENENVSSVPANSIDPSHPPLPNSDLDESNDQSGSSTNKKNKLQQVLDDHHKSKYFKKLDHHTRF